MPQTKYKLTYFPVKGRAEPARLMFAAAGVPYQDVRVEFKDWPELKPKTPQGVLPMLEEDGGKYVLVQSGAINRYLAREFKMYGKNNGEAAAIDLFLETLADMTPKRVAVIQEKDETKQAALKKELEEEISLRFFGILEPIIKKHGKNGFAVGDKFSLADAVLYNHLEFSLAVPALKANKDTYPALFRNRQKVESIPAIKAWLDKRPDTDR